MSATRRTLLAVAALLVLAPPPSAHDFWIQPSNHRPALDERVAVELMVGEAGQGEPARRDDERIVRFAMIEPGGSSHPTVVESPIMGLDGHAPAGWLRPAAPGPVMLVFTNTPARIELAAEKFEAYLREEGLEAIVTQRAERGLSGQPARELYSRCAKALLEVRDASGRPAGQAPRAQSARAGEPSLFTVPVGMPLELVPGVDPFQLAAEGALKPLPIALLLDGEPLAGASVHAMRLDPDAAAGEAPLGARTDAGGRCVLQLPGPGRWLIAAVHMREAAAGADADYESLWASLSFEVPAAAPTPARTATPTPTR